jgi:predicted RND superfamily exporter protein
MQEPENVRSAIEAAASNPKTAAAVAASTTAIGAATKLEALQGWLSVVSMGVGIATALVVLGIQLIRLEKAWRERAQQAKEED